MNNVEKLEKIKNDRNFLINILEDKLRENMDDVSLSLKNIDIIFKEDEEAINKYQAIKKAQEMILSLAEEIINAKNKDDVIIIRKKLNYYISVIRNELKKRNVSDEVIDKYQNSVCSLRRNISQSIRIAKRENNIE